MKLKTKIKVALFPIYSFFTQKCGFTFFFRSSGSWFAWTRGVSFRVKYPNIHALDYFRHFVPDNGGVVFDCGGELGFECEQFAKIVGPKGKVFTFECLPVHISHLKKLSSEYDNIQLIDKACWNKPQKLKFYIGHTDGSGSAVSDAKGQVGQDLANTQGDFFEVEANTLDYFWSIYAKNKPIDFLKMDIEGAEYEALAGASKVLANTKKIVVAAYHIRDGARTSQKVKSILCESGFSVRVDENDHVYGIRNSN
jgi:FkbM family methyltransferase